MLHSNLNNSTTIEPTPAKATHRRTASLNEGRSHSPELIAAEIEDVRSSATYKVKQDVGRLDHDLRHILGHISLIERADEELREIRRQRMSVPLSQPCPEDSIRSPPLALPKMEVEELEVDDEESSEAPLPLEPPPAYSEHAAPEYSDDNWSSSSDSDSDSDAEESDGGYTTIADDEDDVEYALIRVLPSSVSVSDAKPKWNEAHWTVRTSPPPPYTQKDRAVSPSARGSVMVYTAEVSH